MGCSQLADEIELIFHRPHVLIDVIGADFIHEGGDVGEEELDVVPVYHHHHVLLEPTRRDEMRDAKMVRSE